jgi:DNA polymerase III subunit epsilon
MPSLHSTTFACIDVETTGLDVKNDRVIEVAAVLFTSDKIVHEFTTLVDPLREIPKASQEIHNISDAMVQGQPKIGDVLPDLLTFVGHHTIVGHGIQFDINILSEEAARYGIPCSLNKNPFIDTLRLARLYGESPSNSLDVLRRHFNIQAEGAHRAFSDVLVNIQVFKHLTNQFSTTDQVFAALEKPIYMKNMPLGKHKGRPLREIPLDYLCWAARQDFDRDLLFSLRSEISRRKKGGTFGDSANPFHTL